MPLIGGYKLSFLVQLLRRCPEISLLVGGRIQHHCMLQVNTVMVKVRIKLHIVAPTNLLLQITQPVGVTRTVQTCICEVTDSNPRQDTRNPK